jgi:hypothetical protein
MQLMESLPRIAIVVDGRAKPGHDAVGLERLIG